MILVDTSVWARHFDRSVDALSILLEEGEVLAHPFVTGEIAMGNLRRREVVLRDFQDLPQAVVATDREVMQSIESHRLFGRGIGWVDAHLLAAARLTANTLLWTFDRRLEVAAIQLDIAFKPE